MAGSLRNTPLDELCSESCFFCGMVRAPSRRANSVGVVTEVCLCTEDLVTLKRGTFSLSTPVGFPPSTHMFALSYFVLILDRKDAKILPRSIGFYQ